MTPIEGQMTEVKGVGKRTQLLDVLETEEDIGSQRKKLKIEKDGNDNLSIEYKEEIQVIFHKALVLLISSTLNN